MEITLSREDFEALLDIADEDVEVWSGTGSLDEDDEERQSIEARVLWLHFLRTLLQPESEAR
jgi:hypothetical protein